MKDRFEAAMTVGTRLNKMTDQLNESIEQFEGALTALNLGVRGTVELESRDGKQRHLVYSKVNKGWTLHVETVDAASQSTCTELVSCSRETRAEATKQFGALIEAMLIEGERQLALVGEAIERVDSLTRTMVERKRDDDSA